MSRAHEALVQASQAEVRVGPAVFRCVRINSARLLAEAVTAVVRAPGDPGKSRRRKTKEVAEQIANDPESLMASVEVREAQICASVVEMKIDGGEWEPTRFTRVRAEENLDAGVLHISRLPPGSLSRLLNAIGELSNEGAYGRSVLSFLGRGS